MISFFKKKVKTKFCLIKTVELTKDGWKTRYHTEVDGHYVTNSLSDSRYEAELFFEKTLELKGATKRKEVVREEYL